MKKLIWDLLSGGLKKGIQGAIVAGIGGWVKVYLIDVWKSSRLLREDFIKEKKEQEILEEKRRKKDERRQRFLALFGK